MSFADVSSIDATDAPPGARASAPPIARATGAARRLAGLDWLRFAATLSMVQGHVFFVVLHPSVTAERWFHAHRYLHGLTAPMFLVGAGFAFAFVTLRAIERGTAPSPWKRLERALLLLVVGYALQAPRISLDAVLALDADGLARAFRMNTLQCIAVSLVIAELAIALGRTRRSFGATMGLAAAIAVGLAPAAWRVDTQDWPVFFGSMLHGRDGSLFPLFPWSGFLFAGAALAAWRADPAQRGVRPGTIPAFAAIGVLAWTAGTMLTEHGVNPFGEHEYWKTSPWFFAIRFGLVVAFFAGLLAIAELAERRSPVLPARASRGLVERVAAETLVVYVVHLLLLYGTSWHRGLGALVGPSLGVARAALVTFAVLVGSIAAALAWHEVKRVVPNQVRWGVRGVLALGLARFLLG